MMKGRFILVLTLVIVSAIIEEGEGYNKAGYWNGQFLGRVLGGNYGNRGVSIIPKLPKSSLEVPTVVVAAVPSVPAVPVRQGRKFSLPQVVSVYVENMQNVLKKAIEATNPSDTSSIKQKVENCKVDLALCQKEIQPKAYCYLNCLIKGDSFLGPLIYTIAQALALLCKPINTVYMKIFDYAEPGFPELKSYQQFLDMLGTPVSEFKDVIPELADAVLPIASKYLVTPLMPLKSVLSELENAMLIQVPGAQYSRMGTVNNPTCNTIHMWDPIEKLVDVLTRDSATTDILLPGYSFINVVAKYTSSRASFRMRVLLEGLRIFGGSSLGMGCRKNSGGNCDDLGKHPAPGFPIPKQAGGFGYRGLLSPKCESKPAPVPTGRKQG